MILEIIKYTILALILGATFFFMIMATIVKAFYKDEEITNCKK